jgi:chemotaxis protein methyltransferase CheR
VVTEGVRRRVSFAHLNLALDVYPSLATGAWGMDLLLCRNVLLYFNPQTVEAVARRLFASLAPGGWLFLASSDPPVHPYAPFQTVVAPEGVFYRRTAPAAITLPARVEPRVTSKAPASEEEWKWARADSVSSTAPRDGVPARNDK